MSKLHLLTERMTMWLLTTVCYASVIGLGYSIASSKLLGWVFLTSLFTFLVGLPTIVGGAIYFWRKGLLTHRVRAETYIGLAGLLLFFLTVAVANQVLRS